MGIYEKSDTVILWRLLEYVSPLGRASITDWRNGLKTAARKADMDYFLRIQAKTLTWAPPYVSPLHGKPWRNLHELRWKSDGVPHRIGGYFSSENEFVMLAGFTHNARKYDPPNVLETLLTRKKLIESSEAKINEYKIISGQRAEE